MQRLKLGILMYAISAVAYGQTTYKYKVDFFGDTILVDQNDKTIGKKKRR